MTNNTQNILCVCKISIYMSLATSCRVLYRGGIRSAMSAWSSDLNDIRHIRTNGDRTLCGRRRRVPWMSERCPRIHWSRVFRKTFVWRHNFQFKVPTRCTRRLQAGVVWLCKDIVLLWKRYIELYAQWVIYGINVTYGLCVWEMYNAYTCSGNSCILTGRTCRL